MVVIVRVIIFVHVNAHRCVDARALKLGSVERVVEPGFEVDAVVNHHIRVAERLEVSCGGFEAVYRLTGLQQRCYLSTRAVTHLASKVIELGGGSHH